MYHFVTLFFSLNIIYLAATAAKSLQLCPTLCDPIYSSPPGPRVPGILQARILEWVAISFSNAESERERNNKYAHVNIHSYIVPSF